MPLAFAPSSRLVKGAVVTVMPLLRLALVTVLFLASAQRQAEAGQAVLTCQDGGSVVGRGLGGHFKTSDLCDVDHQCDGVCTFQFTDKCLKCYLGPGCRSPDGVFDACPPDVPPPCPTKIPTYFVGIIKGKAGHRRVRLGGLVVTLRCMPNPHCTTTTTTTPPNGNPDLTGDYVFIDTAVADSCPVSASAQFVQGETRAVRIVQGTTTVSMCLDGVESVVGTLSSSPTGFTLRDGSHSLIDQGTAYDVSEAVTLSSTGTQLAATRQWNLAYSYGQAAPACSRAVTGLLEPAPALFCLGYTECVFVDPCDRCMDGVCRFLPGCRSPYRPQ
jgi:hypothetical protein